MWWLRAGMMPLLGVAVVGCGGWGNPPSDVGHYLNVKKAYVEALEKAVPELRSPEYRLAVIPPFVEAYAPGTPLAKGSFEPLTDSCRVPERDMEPKTLATLPVSKKDRTFKIELGLPSLLAEAVKEITDISAAIRTQALAEFGYDNLTVRNPRTDRLDAALRNADCLSAIAGEEIVLVRGLMLGTEVVTTTRSLGAGVTTKVLKGDTISVRYDASGGYEVKDTKPVGKMWIVALRKIEVPGMPPTSSAAERRSRIEDFLRAETTKAPLGRDAAPSNALIERLERVQAKR